MRDLKIIFLFIALILLSPKVFGQKLTPEMLGMAREDIRFTDNQLRLFNGRGCIYVKQNSLTGLHAIQFPPIDISQYQFRLDFRDENNNILIQDNIPELWDDWKEKKSGYDPLGVNFRAGYPNAVLSQDEYWKPNSYSRNGTYHKRSGKQWISFAIETEAVVSGNRDEVYLEATITNRDDKPLSLTLIPVQLVRFEDPSTPGNENIYKRISPYLLQNSQYQISLSSDLKKHDDNGWKFVIEGKSTRVARIAIHAQSVQNEEPNLYFPDIEQHMLVAKETTKKRLLWAAEKLPTIKTENKRLDELYKRSILTVVESKWERENFIANPFWAAGQWLYTIPWDLCFLSDMITMMSPESMRETISLFFSEDELGCSNIGWDGCAPGVFYIMQPFALKIMIEAYLRQTGDIEFLNKDLSGRTILGWMKIWGDILQKDFTTNGMIDIGNDPEALVEIRTDGYDNIVPVLNGHAVEYFKWLGLWCGEFNDPDSTKFNKLAADLEKRFHENLWNSEKRWFDNIYPNGGRKPVYSNLLFDLIGTDVLTGEERLGLLSHLNDNEFLGRYNIYSISRQDRVHWDRVDTDWGGGGSYTGVPMQLVRNLYQTGMGELAWTILNRFTKYIDHFPYISQNLRADEIFQDESSMAMAICAGAGVEAIVFGLFGLNPQIDGTLDIRPYYSYEVGKSSLNDYQFRGHSYDVIMNRYGFQLIRDGNDYGSYRHGESVRILPDGKIMTYDDMRVSIPTVDEDNFVFVDTKKIILNTETPGASIHYSLDGSKPTKQSTTYNGPFTISESSQIKAIAYHTDLKASETSIIYFEKVDESDVELPPLIIKDFMISQSFHSYVGAEGKNNYPMDRSDINWKKGEVDERGIVWLSQQLTPFNNCHAFAVTEIISTEEVEATILTGTNDGAFIWLNDKLILESYRERPLYYNQFSLPVKLKKGKNRLVLMVLQSGGSWGFHVNIEAIGNKLKIVFPDVELLNKK